MPSSRIGVAARPATRPGMGWAEARSRAIHREAIAQVAARVGELLPTGPHFREAHRR
ncbi:MULTISPECIES: hypothetical protein [unclassified Streptomyces]|uniref:hypothetical protein n=1 Tax=unclassified Streptomyces TaxID=2593676 RepID=UPI00166179E0|nr:MULTISPECIES: hypothetical protein [unclassified Streptomyces]